MSEKAAEDLNQSIHELHESPVTPGGTLAPPEEPPKSIREILLQMKQMQEESSRDHLSQMRQLLVQEEIGANLSIKAFEWMTCKPGKLFHPVSRHASHPTRTSLLTNWIGMVGSVIERYPRSL
jgi:hypothetical protein